MAREYVHDTLDVVSIVTLQNIDNIIEYSPYSTDIILKRVTKDGQWGYEEHTPTSTVITKGLIKYNPERSFLRKVGIFTEEDLPIIGFFKDSDKIKKDDTVTQVTHDFVDGQTVDIERNFTIIDILSFGDMRTGKKVFKLAPVRGETT